MKYRVNLRKTEEGYSVWVPGLPGCWSQDDYTMAGIVRDAGLIIDEFKNLL